MFLKSRGTQGELPASSPRIGKWKTTGHKVKERGERFKRDLRDDFSQRVVGIWNKPPEKMVEAGTTLKTNWTDAWIQKVWRDMKNR